MLVIKKKGCKLKGLSLKRVLMMRTILRNFLKVEILLGFIGIDFLRVKKKRGIMFSWKNRLLMSDIIISKENNKKFKMLVVLIMIK